MYWQTILSVGVAILVKSSVSVVLLLSLCLASCASQEPLEVTSTTQPATATTATTDRAIIAEAVGSATAGSRPLAWANPATGSAGVIEQVGTTVDQENGCRNFTTSQQSLDGKTRFDGVACPTGQSWKLTGSTDG
jgi:hypothetical protein